MNLHKTFIVWVPCTIIIMLLTLDQKNIVLIILLSLMLVGELAYLLGYYSGKIIEEDNKIKFKSNKKSEKESDKKTEEDDEDGDDFLFCCIKLIVYTAKYCGCNDIDDETRVKIRNFIIKNDPQSLSTRLEDFDKLVILASNTEVSYFDISILCEKIKRKLNNNNNPSWKFSNRNLILDILFSVVYQSKNSSFILEYISKIIGDEYLFETKRKEYERKYSKKTETNNEKRQTEKENKEENNSNKKNDPNSLFVTLTLELLVEAMKVDRSKMVCELDVIKAFIMKYDKENFQERVLEVKKYLSYEYIEMNVEGACTRINKQFRQDYKKREEILKFLVDLIYADETCTNIEYNFLKKVAERLKVSKSAFDFMRMKYENRKNKSKQNSKQQSNKQNNNSKSNNKQNYSQPKYTSELEKAYAALGISQDATDKELSATWRNLMRVNHPDLMEKQGAEAVRKATAKCQEINKAFEIIKASRGMR